MSKIVLYPANDYDFDAADVAAYLAGLTSGVFSSAEDFPVTAAGGLKVTVGAGRGWVHPSRFTGYSITKREADTLTMPLADPSLPASTVSSYAMMPVPEPPACRCCRARHPAHPRPPPSPAPS